MLKTSLCAAIGFAALLAAPVSFADDKDKDKNEHHNGNSTEIPWEEFKARCENADQFKGNQREPRQIELLCTDERLNWVAALPGEVPLIGTRKVTTQLVSDKFHVPPVTEQVELPTKPGACTRFKQVRETFTFHLPINCDDIKGVKGDFGIDDLCMATLDKAKAEKPKGAVVEETGLVVDTCGGNGQENGKGGPKI